MRILFAYTIICFLTVIQVASAQELIPYAFVRLSNDEEIAIPVKDDIYIFDARLNKITRAHREYGNGAGPFVRGIDGTILTFHSASTVTIIQPESTIKNRLTHKGMAKILQTVDVAGSSKDGSIVAFITNKGELFTILYDGNSYVLSSRLCLFNEDASNLAVSENGRYAVASRSAQTKVVDLIKGEIITELPFLTNYKIDNSGNCFGLWCKSEESEVMSYLEKGSTTPKEWDFKVSTSVKKESPNFPHSFVVSSSEVYDLFDSKSKKSRVIHLENTKPSTKAVYLQKINKAYVLYRATNTIDIIDPENSRIVATLELAKLIAEFMGK
jgi:hypothetical protein